MARRGFGGGPFPAFGSGGGGAFQAVRSLVNFLGLRKGGTRLSGFTAFLTYTRTWYATPYLQKLAIDYLQNRPEYNAGWKAIIDNMCHEIETGKHIYMKIDKIHTYNQNMPHGQRHSAEYVVESFFHLEGATNHPDLMRNYIYELNTLFEDYKASYEQSSVQNVSSEEEWQARQAQLDEYRNNVEDLMSEID